LLFVWYCAPARASDSLKIDPLIDIPVTVAAGSIWVALYLDANSQSGLERPLSTPPGGLDALHVDHEVKSMDLASDIVLYGTLGGGLAATCIQGRKQLGPRVLIYWQVFAVNGLLTDLTKHAVRRPRPYTITSRDHGVHDDLSFFSGHTSFTAAIAFSTVRAIELTSPLSKGARIALYGAATTATLSVGALRVAAGHHFPSDVIVGALVGSSIGLLIPELHRVKDIGISANRTHDGGWQVALASTW